MRALELDFQTRQMPAARIGHGLVFVGGLAAVLVLGAQARVSGEIERYREAEFEAGQAGAASALPRGVASEREAIDGARAVVAHLAGPWERLFQTLEKIREPDVALLALTPDVQKQKIRIQAEAKHFGAMLSYYRALEQSPGLRDVALVEHEIRHTDPQRPVRFTMTAAWGELR